MFTQTLTNNNSLTRALQWKRRQAAAEAPHCAPPPLPPLATAGHRWSEISRAVAGGPPHPGEMGSNILRGGNGEAWDKRAGGCGPLWAWWLSSSVGHVDWGAWSVGPLHSALRSSVMTRKALNPLSLTSSEGTQKRTCITEMISYHSVCTRQGLPLGQMHLPSNSSATKGAPSPTCPVGHLLTLSGDKVLCCGADRERCPTP